VLCQKEIAWPGHRTCAGINLRRAARAITNQYDHRLLAACGLRATQLPPLVVLYLAGPQTIQEIAERLDLTDNPVAQHQAAGRVQAC
jgi:uncharacterized protein YfaT (DUF1175 family)